MFRLYSSKAQTFSKRLISTVSNAEPEVYTRGNQIMHFGIGGSMLACIGFVLAAQNTKDKTDKGTYMFRHKSFGLLSAIFLIPRLGLAIVSKRPGAVPGSSVIESYLAKSSHVIMWALTITLPVSGVVMGAYSGFGIPFFFTTVPSIKKDPSIAKPAYEYHKQLGTALEYLVPVHFGGAMFHLVKGQPILQRMFGFLLPKGAPPVIPK